MERYEVLNVAGEGSFGRVYKAKRKDTNEIVAFKVIQKRGRPEKELEGLRRECEIQRHLHHPNVIQMLESFETETEIVVVSEFADRQLYELLGNAGYLPEAQVQKITCDLVAALFYLHSNRVLHRDLKPQNVLISVDDTAKLCDFGFARSMSRGTMLLTSIKGTPLYMAPELVTESPYDHNADLWSLGCIVYELLVGVPPFSTNSILHLVHLIRHETIRFPDFVSPSCVTFLQGLLQKDPNKRLSWPELLHHPFLQGKVVAPKDQAMAIPPFTDALSDSQQKVKESQRQHLAEQISQQSRHISQTVRILEEYDRRQHRKLKSEAKQVNVSLETRSETDANEALLSPNKTPVPCVADDLKPENLKRRSRKSINSSDSSDCDTPCEAQPEWFDPNPTQNDEWSDYLQRSMEEVMAGDLSCLLKPPLVAVATAPLSRRTASPKVIEYVACLLSIPFVTEDIAADNITTLLETYLESKIVHQILQGIKILITDRTTKKLIPLKEFRAEQLHALERVLLLLSHLVHRQSPELGTAFARHLCESLTGDGVTLLRHLLTLGKRKARVVADTLAILAQIARTQPQHMYILQQVMLDSPPVDMVALMGHSQELVRARSCIVLRLLAQHCSSALGSAWSPNISQRLKLLQKDEEHPTVQQAASDAVRVLRKLHFYTPPKNVTG